MLWSLVSSAFVIYLYRALSATAGAETAERVTSADTIDTELANLNGQIDAIENMTGGKTRRTAP